MLACVPKSNSLKQDDKIQREGLLPWNAFISFILTTCQKHSKSPSINQLNVITQKIYTPLDVSSPCLTPGKLALKTRWFVSSFLSASVLK